MTPARPAMPSADLAVQSRYLERLSPRARTRISGLVGEVSERIEAWASAYPSMRQARVAPLVLSVAAAAPWAALDAVEATARVSLWVFTFDDAVDEERLAGAPLAERVAHYRSVARGVQAPDADDDLARALRDARVGLARYPLFAALGNVWAEALCGTLDAMLRENGWREALRTGRPELLPSYATYVSTGLYSIGGPPHVWAAVITTDDASAVDCLPRLASMERAACSAIRLANDLRSYEKELREENLNSLRLLALDAEQHGMASSEALASAERQVRGDITAYLEVLDALERDRRTETGQPESTIANIARFVCEFYESYDYHTFGDGQRVATADGARRRSISEGDTA